MAKQIIRLTESDLHRIISESVRRIIREQDEDLEAQYEQAKAKVKALKGKDKTAWLAAVQEMQALKEKLGKTQVVKAKQGQSGHEGPTDLGRKIENPEEGRGKHKYAHPWNNVKDNLANKKKMDQEHFQKQKVNDIDAALGA